MASLSFPAPQHTLTPDDARLMTLRAQGLIGTEGRRGGVPGMLRRLGAVEESFRPLPRAEAEEL